MTPTQARREIALVRRRKVFRIVERGWVLRRKSDGYIWSVYPGNPDARLGWKPFYYGAEPKLGPSLSPEYWEIVEVERTVTLRVLTRARRKGRRNT